MTEVLLDARIRVGGPTVYARDLIAALREHGGYQVAVVGDALTRRAFTPWGRACVAAAARRRGADLVHGLHVEMPPGRLPAVVTIQDVVPLDHPASVPNPVGRAVYRRVLRQSLGRAERVIVPSPMTGERLVTLGARPDRLDVVPLGIGPRFRPPTPEEREEARRRFADGRRYVVASTGGRFHKNLAGMSAAAARLPADVVVAATGRLEAPGVRFVGALGNDDLRLFYGGAEVMVLPAFTEGFGLPAVEALACGVPVVCGPRTGALPFIGGGAVVADVTRPAELAAGIRSVLDGQVRLAADVSGLTAAAMAEATVAVYDRALTSR